MLNFVYIGSVSSMPDCLCPHHSQTESVLNVYKSHALAIMDNFLSEIVTLKICLNYCGFFKKYFLVKEFIAIFSEY